MVFRIDYRCFIRTACAWNALSPAARLTYSERAVESPLPEAETFGRYLEPLVQAGFLEPTRGCRFRPLPRGFRSIVHLLMDLDLFAERDLSRLQRYVKRVYSGLERDALRDTNGSRFDPGSLFVAEITSSAYIKRFFNESALASQARVRACRGLPAPGEEDFANAKPVLAYLMSASVPLTFRELRAQFPRFSDDEFAAAAWACVQSALAFMSVDGGSLDLVVWVWPDLSDFRNEDRARASRPDNAVPEPFGQTGACFHPFLADDMVALVVYGRSHSLRLTQKGTLSRRQHSELAPRLCRTAAELSDFFDLSTDTRVGRALDCMARLGFLEQRPGIRAYGISRSGLDWVCLDERGRYVALLTALRDLWHGFPLVPPSAARWRRGGVLCIDGSAVQAALGLLHADTCHDFRQFLDFAAVHCNPLASAGTFTRLDDEQEVELHPAHAYGEWSGFLRSYVEETLLPLGALSWTVARGRFHLRLSPAGSYILAFSPELRLDWTDAARSPERPFTGSGVLVNEDFTIDFFVDALEREAKILPFCRPLKPDEAIDAARGKHRASRPCSRRAPPLFLPGPRPLKRFAITRESVFEAAAAGIPLPAIRSGLMNAATSTVPGQVLDEITAWYAMVRRVSARPAFVVESPDDSTAARLCAADPRRVRRGPGSLILVSGDVDRTAFKRILHRNGVFLDFADDA